MAIGTFTNSALKYVESLAGLRFRHRLTAHLHKLYMRNNGFYRLSAGAPGDSEEEKKSSGLATTKIDHVDQRIAEDVKVFCDKLAHLYGHSFKPILEFSMIVTATLTDLGPWRPFLLFLLLGSLQNALRMVTPNISAMIAAEQSAEGSFRHAHSRLRNHAEAVAFLKGSKAEERILNESFGGLYRLRCWHELRRILKSLADQMFKFQGIVIGGIFIHIPFLQRTDMTPADRIAAFRSCEVLMLKSGAAFTEILLLSKHLQTLAGYAARIGELLEALGDSGSRRERGEGERGNTLMISEDAKDEGVETSNAIEFHGVSVGAPEVTGGYRTLVEDLNLKVTEGLNVLITGPNGCGKTSLFRVLAGLWNPTKGTIRKPHTFIMWLPQDPYLVTGTLRDQVTYPDFYGTGSAVAEEIDRKVTAALNEAGLSKIIARGGAQGLDQLSAEWKNELSGGERQRVAFARLFFHLPRFAVIDEATSAINSKGELELYEKLREKRCTIFSIAHRASVRKFHRIEVEFMGDGSGQYRFFQLKNNGKGNLDRLPIDSEGISKLQ